MEFTRFLKFIIPKILEKHGIKNITIGPSDYSRLALVGTEDVFKKYYSHQVYKIGEEERDNTPDYVKAQREQLEHYDLLHFDAIEKAVDKVAFDIKNSRSGSSLFVDQLGEKLKALTKSAASDKKAIEDELKDKVGKDSDSWSFDF